MIADILVPFTVIGLAELGDKTQLCILLLASRMKKPLHILLGVMLALLIVDGIAILIGSWITKNIPNNLLRTTAGIIFIIFGILILRTKEGGECKLYNKNSFLSGFVLIFLSEWGDKTQIASGLFATKYNALMVLIGTMVALTILSVMAIYLGNFIAKKVNTKVITKVAGVLFIGIGASFFLF